MTRALDSIASLLSPPPSAALADPAAESACREAIDALFLGQLALPTRLLRTQSLLDAPSADPTPVSTPAATPKRADDRAPNSFGEQFTLRLSAAAAAAAADSPRTRDSAGSGAEFSPRFSPRRSSGGGGHSGGSGGGGESGRGGKERGIGFTRRPHFSSIPAGGEEDAVGVEHAKLRQMIAHDLQMEEEEAAALRLQGARCESAGGGEERIGIDTGGGTPGGADTGGGKAKEGDTGGGKAKGGDTDGGRAEGADTGWGNTGGGDTGGDEARGVLPGRRSGAPPPVSTPTSSRACCTPSPARADAPYPPAGSSGADPARPPPVSCSPPAVSSPTEPYAHNAVASLTPNIPAAAYPLQPSDGPSPTILSPTAAAVAQLRASPTTARPARRLSQPFGIPSHLVNTIPGTHRPAPSFRYGMEASPSGPTSPHGTESGLSVAESFADALTDLEEFASADEA
jgi:hypothetical protein